MFTIDEFLNSNFALKALFHFLFFPSTLLQSMLTSSLWEFPWWGYMRRGVRLHHVFFLERVMVALKRAHSCSTFRYVLYLSSSGWVSVVTGGFIYPLVVCWSLLSEVSQILLSWRPISCGTMSCRWISKASLTLRVCQRLTEVSSLL